MNLPGFLGGDEDSRRRLVAGIGYLAVVLAAITAFVPVVGDAIAATVGVVVGAPPIIVVAGLVGGGYALVQLYRTGSEESDRTPLVYENPERAHYSENHVAGSEIDDSIEAIGGELPESESKDWWTYREKNDVKESLSAVAMTVLADEHDVSRERAAKMLEAGTWTDDPRAARFLGDESAAALPLRVQFYDWLSGEAYERRVEATIGAVAAHAGLDRSGADSSTAGDGDGDEPSANVDERSATVDVGVASTEEETSTDWRVEDTEFGSFGDDDGSKSDGSTRPDDEDATADVVAETDGAGPYPVDVDGVAGWTGGDDT